MYIRHNDGGALFQEGRGGHKFRSIDIIFKYNNARPAPKIRKKYVLVVNLSGTVGIGRNYHGYPVIIYL